MKESVPCGYVRPTYYNTRERIRLAGSVHMSLQGVYAYSAGYLLGVSGMVLLRWRWAVRGRDVEMIWGGGLDRWREVLTGGGEWWIRSIVRTG